MAKIKIVGDAMVLVSTLKAEVISKLAKFRNADLTVKDDKELPVYAVKVGYTASFNKMGVVFTGANASGFATCTIALPIGIAPADKKQYATENFGSALIELNKHEATIATRATTLETEFTTAARGIEVEA